MASNGGLTLLSNIGKHIQKRKKESSSCIARKSYPQQGKRSCRQDLSKITIIVNTYYLQSIHNAIHKRTDELIIYGSGVFLFFLTVCTLLCRCVCVCRTTEQIAEQTKASSNSLITIICNFSLFFFFFPLLFCFYPPLFVR